MCSKYVASSGFHCEGRSSDNTLLKSPLWSLRKCSTSLSLQVAEHSIIPSHKREGGRKGGRKGKDGREEEEERSGGRERGKK